MAAKEDCRKILNINTAKIQQDYLNGIIDITTAKNKYQAELNNYIRCSGDNSTLSITNPFEPKISNFIFIVPLTLKQGIRKTFFKVNDVISGERLENGNVKAVINSEIIEIDKSYVEDTMLDVTPNTYIENIPIIKNQESKNNGILIAKWVLGIIIFLLFIKLIKVI